MSMVTVGWYLHPIEAEIARGMLESEGIPAFLHSVGYSQLNWIMTLALGGILLQVPASAEQEARALLASIENRPDDGTQPSESCPKCGGTEVEKVKMTWRVALLIVHFLNIPLPFSTRERKCRTCGRVWDSVDDH